MSELIPKLAAYALLALIVVGIFKAIAYWSKKK